MRIEKDVLITGAAGFIGSHLGNRLVGLGASVTGVDSFFHPSEAPREFKVETGDVRFADLVAMRARNADVVIHLAAAINVDFSHTMPEAAFDINVDGTMNVLEACRKLDREMVFASSSEIYGTYNPIDCHGMCDHPGMDENHPLDGQSPYAASKIAGDRMCKAWADTYGMRISVVRLFNTYGPGQADDGYGGVIAKFTRQALTGKALTIYGDGNQRRDYLWVEDAVDAFILATRKRFDGPVNFGTGTTVSIGELADMVGEEVGRPWGFTFEPPRPGEINCLRAGAFRARDLGWEPKTTFQNGLREYVKWAKNQNQG